MAEVKWIKLTVDMFDNRKIKHLRKLPDGNNIVLIWVMLLTLAGRCNAGGMIFLTENIPYTAKMLADELDFEETTVTLALEALEHLGMITTYGGLSITNWAEYQSVDGMDKIREQNRARQARFAERKKSLPETHGNARKTHENATETHDNVTPNVSPTLANATEEEVEEDKEEDNKKVSKRFTPPTTDEVRQYCRERGNTVDAERFVDYYSANGWKVGKNAMKDWRAAVRTWERQEKPSGKKPPSYDIDKAIEQSTRFIRIDPTATKREG